ncbi:MAG TPA: biotin/lipoyl-containing protein [Qipengyuania sp.]|nr:biotin/lipoyl-containing protein [Qipengyuania sp.]
MFERDCSLQRRHQKVIEEAPAPGMDEATREAVCAAAVRAAQAVNYEGAGTIEFIADASEGLRADRIFFMEMNTRLQVEHPVTEEITGVDLVEWQLRVAGGEPIPVEQDELSIDGHAIEVRLYAEDVAAGFLPSIGELALFDISNDAWDTRVETGFSAGDRVSPYYDPMIAKLVVKGWDRESAIEEMSAACARVRIWPVKTNAWFAKRLLDDQKFRWGLIDTGLIERGGTRFTSDPEPSQLVLQHALQAHLFFNGGHQLSSFARTGLGGFRPLGWRLNADPAQGVVLDVSGEAVFVSLDETVDTSIIDFDTVGGDVLISEDGATFCLPLRNARGTGAHHAHDGDIIAPMPGKVIAVDVAEGDQVTAGQRLIVLEAMKMEHALTAPFDGIVTELSVSAGSQVQVEAVLAVVEANPPPTGEGDHAQHGGGARSG